MIRRAIVLSIALLSILPCSVRRPRTPIDQVLDGLCAAPAVPRSDLQFAAESPCVSIAGLRMTSLLATGARESRAGLVCYRAAEAALVYRPTHTGVKEDLVVGEQAFGNGTFGWTLEMDGDREARLEEDGSIGVYEPARFRLVARLPAPVAHDATGTALRARYTWDPPMLVVRVEPVPAMQFPVVIDPTIVLTTDADFRLGNDEGLARFAGDQIHRDATGAWRLEAFAAAGTLPSSRWFHASTVHDKRLYVVAGHNGSASTNDVQVAPVNDDGTVGSFAALTPVPGPVRHAHGAVAYSGYLYVLGGYSTGTGGTIGDVQIGKLNPDGTIASWQTGPPIPGGRRAFISVATNGCLYVVAGASSGGLTQAVVYSAIRADGTLAGWTSTEDVNSFHYEGGGFAHDGHLYAIAGQNTSFDTANVDFARINADGTLSPWKSTTALGSARSNNPAWVCGGIAFTLGGIPLTVEAAPILPGGGVGAWSTTATLAAVRDAASVAAYNGRAFLSGGFVAGSPVAEVLSTRALPGHSGSWTATTPLPAARAGFTALAWNGFLYSVGGSVNATAYTTDVQVAPITADGAIGSWSLTTPYVTARKDAAAAIVNGYLYIVGGINSGGTRLADVQYAPILPGGAIGSWTSTSSIPVARLDHAVTEYNGRLYVLGGNASAGISSDVYCAAPAANGSIASWATVASLPAARTTLAAVGYSGSLYAVGGWNGSAFNTISMTAINADGTLAGWSATSSFIAIGYNHSAFASGGHLYILGGTSSSPASDVQFAPINGNGSLGTWTATTGFTPSRFDHGSTVHNGMVYIVGGFSGGNTAVVESARITSLGTASPPVASTPLPAPRTAHGAAAAGGFLYVAGGLTPGQSNEVLHAPLGTDGSVGTWIAGPAFSTPRHNLGVAAHKGYLYVFGGNDGSSYFGDVQVAPLAANGSVGPWSSTTALPGLRSIHASFIHRDRLYVLGGRDGTGAPLATVAFAPLNPDGSLGGWVTTTPFATPRWGLRAVTHNNFAYVLGGWDGTGPLADVQRAIINADGTLGPWSPVLRLTSSRFAFAAGLSGGYLHILGGANGTASLADGWSTGTLPGGALGAWTPVPSLSGARSSSPPVCVDGVLYVIGGDDGVSAVATVDVIPLRTPAPRAAYSRLVDLGADATVSSVTTNGGGSTGSATIDVRTATSASPDLGAASSTPVTFGAAVPIGATARYVLLRHTLDDATSDLTNPDNTSRLRIDDITIVSTAPPGTPSAPAQFQSDGITVLGAGLGASSTSVVFKATLTDPDAGDTIRLRVEVLPLSSPFTGSPTQSSGFVTSGSLASVTVSGLIAGTSYHWQCWAEDNGGASSAALPFGGSPDFFINQAPAAPALTQFQSDGVTPLADGGSTTVSTVVLKGTRPDPDPLSQVKLQVELQPAAASFTSPATPVIDGAVFFETTLGAPATTGAVTASSLAIGGYHWQARVVDDAGAASTWTPFSGSATHFTITTANNAPGVPMPLSQTNADDSPLATGGTANSAGAKLIGTTSDPDGADTVKLQIELRAVGIPFSSPALPVIDNIVFFETALAAPATVTLPLLGLGDGAYHWQARAVDNNGAASAWTPFGANLETSADFVVDQVNDPPTINPTTVDQFQSDAVTAILEGGTAAGAGVVFKARPVDSNGNPVKLQVEVRLTGDALQLPANPVIDGAIYFETTLQPSDTEHSIATGLLPNGTRHWAYRAVDALGAASAWTEFGTAGNTDFDVVANGAPGAPSAPAQFHDDGITPLPLGNSTTPGTVVIAAVVTDPEGLATRLQVEVQPVGVPFTGVPGATSNAVPSGSTATVSVSTLADGPYHWQARGIDALGVAGAFVAFGGNSEPDPDFRVDTTNGPPSAPSSLGQYVPPGTVGLALGGSPVGRTVVLRALANDDELGRLAIEVELRPAGVPFTDIATHVSEFGSAGIFLQLTLDDLGDGAYHWQARATDEFAQSSAWQSYGGNPETSADFTITATQAVPPNAPLNLQQKTSNDLAVVNAGATIAQAAIRLKALVVHPRTEIVKLQVEVKPVSQPFAGVADRESTFVDSGSIAEVILFGFPNTDYHWQARTVDSKGTSSAWSSYGANPETGADFSVSVAVNNPPDGPNLIEQFSANGITEIVLGGATTQSTVVFHGFVSDVDGDSVRLEVEVKPVGVAFDGARSGASDFQFDGSSVRVAIGALPDGRHHWRLRCVDASGAASPWVPYGANPETDGDFIVNSTANQSPASAASLQQLRDNGSLVVGEGAIAGPTDLTFRSDADDADGDPVRLEIEVRDADQPFGATATHSGEFVPPGFVADSVIGRFVFHIAQHWRARIVDVNGASTGWVDYGAGDPDFTASSSIAGGGDKPKNCGSMGMELLLPMLLLSWLTARCRRSTSPSAPASR